MLTKISAQHPLPKPNHHPGPCPAQTHTTPLQKMSPLACRSTNIPQKSARHLRAALPFPFVPPPPPLHPLLRPSSDPTHTLKYPPRRRTLKPLLAVRRLRPRPSSIPMSAPASPHTSLLHLAHCPFGPGRPRRARLRCLASLAGASPANENHLVQTLCAHGHLARAAALLQGLPAPTQRTYESLLLAAARAGDAALAAAVHRRLESDPVFRSDPFLSTRLIDAYATLSALPAARQVFDEAPVKNIFVWNAMLKTLALADHGEEALARLADMGRLGVSVDSYSYAHGLKACIAASASHAPASARVREMHAHAIRRGYGLHTHVATTLIDCYAKLGTVTYAERVFAWMPERNVVSWSAMIGCYAKNERPGDAVELFQEMMASDADMVPNSITIVLVSCMLVLG